MYLFYLRYLRQVLDETLRCSIVGTWAARVQETDTTIGGYDIPKNVRYLICYPRHTLFRVLQIEMPSKPLVSILHANLNQVKVDG